MIRWPSVLILLVAVTPSAHAGPISREELRDQLKDAWAGLESVSFRSIERSDGGPRVDQEYDFALASGGRSAYHGMNDVEGRPKRVEDVREDGKRLYQVSSFRGHPGSTESVSISNQRSTSEQYRGGMFRALWAFLPGGKPIHAWLDGAAISYPEGDKPDGLVRVATIHGKRPLILDLDPRHDYLPRRVDLVGKQTIVVEEFARDSGRWFPARGHSTERLGDAVEDARMTFVVDRLRINRPIDPARFGPPPAPEGGMIVDHVQGKRQYVGGTSARDAAVNKYIGEPAQSARLVADTSARGFPWSWLLVGTSAVVLLLLLFARMRG